MLILTRKLGESIIIGDDIKITVLDKCINQIKLSVNDSEGVILDIQETITIKDGITVKLVKIEKKFRRKIKWEMCCLLLQV